MGPKSNQNRFHAFLQIKRRMWLAKDSSNINEKFVLKTTLKEDTKTYGSVYFVSGAEKAIGEPTTPSRLMNWPWPALAWSVGRPWPGRPPDHPKSTPRSTPKSAKIDPPTDQNRPPDRPKSTSGPTQIDPKTDPKDDQKRRKKSTKTQQKSRLLDVKMMEK